MILRPPKYETLLQPNGLPFAASKPENKLLVIPDLDHIDDMEQVIHETEASTIALDALTHSPEFQDAALRRNHDKEIEVIVIFPGDSRHEILREAARCVEHVIFARDGESRESLDHHYGPYEDKTAFILTISRTSGYATPLSMTRLVHAGEKGMPSVDDMIGPPWFQDPAEMMAQTRITRPDIDNPDRDNPFHMMQMPDLRTYPGALDFVTMGTLPQYRKPSSTAGVPVAVAMYNAACREITRPAEIELWATNLDKLAQRSIQVAIGSPLSLFGEQDKVPEEQQRLKQLPYYAVYDPVKKRYSNYTRPDYTDVPEWYARIKHTNPKAFAAAWGDNLGDQVAVTTLGSLEDFKGDWKSEKWERTRRSLGEISISTVVRAPTNKNLYVARPPHGSADVVGDRQGVKIALAVEPALQSAA